METPLQNATGTHAGAAARATSLEELSCQPHLPFARLCWQSDYPPEPDEELLEDELELLDSELELELDEELLLDDELELLGSDPEFDDEELLVDGEDDEPVDEELLAETGVGDELEMFETTLSGPVAESIQPRSGDKPTTAAPWVSSVRNSRRLASLSFVFSDIFSSLHSLNPTHAWGRKGTPRMR